jgi:hypothetical protein
MCRGSADPVFNPSAWGVNFQSGGLSNSFLGACAAASEWIPSDLLRAGHLAAQFKGVAAIKLRAD